MSDVKRGVERGAERSERGLKRGVALSSMLTSVHNSSLQGGDGAIKKGFLKGEGRGI